MTTQALINAYKQAMLDIMDRVRRKARVGDVTGYEEQLISEVDKILRSLGVDTKKWLESVVPAAYQQAATETFRQLSMQPTASVAFTGINQAAVRVIVNNTQGTVTDALQEVGRRLNDQIRQASIEASQKKLTTNQTIREMQKELEKTLAEQGCAAGVMDSRDRLQPLDSYSQMVARTTTRETTNTATMNIAHDLGAHLFMLSTHYPTCHLCAPRQGRVYRDIDFPDGDERNKFPHISQAFPGWPEFKNIHPNCRHVLVAVGWDALSRETQEGYLADASKPFNVDPRSQKEIKAYNLGQAENRMMRNDRKQWERMRQRLGDDAPKSFSAFRRIKYADGGVRRAFYGKDANGHEVLHCGLQGNSKSWGLLQAKYKAMGYYERALDQEPGITATVKDVAQRVGMEPVGLEYRVKSRESYLRKVEANYSPDGNQYEVRDIIRFTYTAPPNALADKTLVAVETFDGMGYNTSVIKNTWDQPFNPYKGINTTITAPSGQKFEMQYHTPESFELKNGQMHKLYESWRTLPAGDPKRKPLESKMQKLSESLVRPKDIERVR